MQLNTDGKKIYSNCSCVRSNPSLLLTSLDTITLKPSDNKPSNQDYLGVAVPGSCPVDCLEKFYIFLAVVCLLKFSGATGRASNFLVSVRCVEEKDKTVAMGFSLTLLSLFAFIPSPILFGYLLGMFFVYSSPLLFYNY